MNRGGLEQWTVREPVGRAARAFRSRMAWHEFDYFFATAADASRGMRMPAKWRFSRRRRKPHGLRCQPKRSLSPKARHALGEDERDEEESHVWRSAKIFAISFNTRKNGKTPGRIGR